MDVVCLACGTDLRKFVGELRQYQAEQGRCPGCRTLVRLNDQYGPMNGTLGLQRKGRPTFPEIRGGNSQNSAEGRGKEQAADEQGSRTLNRKRMMKRDPRVCAKRQVLSPQRTKH